MRYDAVVPLVQDTPIKVDVISVSNSFAHG